MSEAVPDALVDSGVVLAEGWGRIGRVAAEGMLRNAELGLDAGRSLLACHSPEDVWRVQSNLMRVATEAAVSDWAKIATAAGDLWTASLTTLRRGAGAFPSPHGR